ncbi:MAG TPA: class I SAM-dependent methyltransferase [Acidimicrobiia bacterium]|jgi:SAM-dependent MidA family methyltransferase|nr:class I SAM-dependent methyltransferase [Acidimicrobiia bacterium]
MSTVAAQLARMIHREGPITFDRFMETALYSDDGFFASGRGAGRADRDFVTSPEVGPLYGACVARALDRMWRALEEPDPFLVVEAGAGNGRLAREVLRAAPACLAALRYVLVERSAALRAEQRDLLPLEPADEALGSFVRRANEDQAVPAAGAGPVFAAVEEMPALSARDTVVLANELLDNLPFGIAQWDGRRWLEVRVGYSEPAFHEVLVPADVDLGYDSNLGYEAEPGTRVPIPRGINEWFLGCEGVVRHGFVLVVDYATTVAELGSRPWLRTYRAHARGFDPLADPGEQDITADVVLEQLDAASPFPLVRTDRQSEWLRALGIDDLVTEGRRVWEAGAARGDLEALAGRSRASEAAALTDPEGLGAHQAVLFGVGGAGRDFSW